MRGKFAFSVWLLACFGAGLGLTLAVGAIAQQTTNYSRAPNFNAAAVPITGGTIDATPIGGTTPAAGAFTTLGATGAVTLSPASANVVLSPTGTGVVTINPATAGTINNAAIGGTTPLAGSFTTLTSTGVTTLKGSTTNDSVAAGNIGEFVTATVASGSAVSLTTATSANVTSISLTAGDWDVSGQVVHNAAATTSITLLQIGISAASATLPTQAGGSGIGTDPLSMWRQAAGVPAGALTTSVGPVRVSLSGTTTIYLVAADTFTVSTMTAYGTIRARRIR